MKHKLFIWLFAVLGLTLNTAAWAQTVDWSPQYSTRWGYLYKNRDAKTEKLGVFSTEASLMLLDSTKTQYFVRVSNGDEGYIDKQRLTKAMFGKTSPGEPQQYFYRGKAGQQGAHLYVQATELRIRSAPTTASNAVGKLSLNAMVLYDYMPLYPEGWVYVGDHFHEDEQFIMAKFLGPELTYDDLYKAYLDVKDGDRTQALVQVGRLRDLAWQNEKFDKLQQSLTLWKEAHVKAGETNAKVDIELELLLAKKLAQKPSFAVIEKSVKALNIRYQLGDLTLIDGKITEKQAQQLQWKRVKNIPDFPECGWDPVFYYSADAGVIAFEAFGRSVLGTVETLKIKEQQLLIFGDQKMDNNYTEEQFIRQFGHLAEVSWISSPHAYRIPVGDAGFYQLVFKSGLLVEVKMIYYC
ncbi:hypothetical protein ACL9RF_10590 [Sphingobacterium sp. Mn56C]|uniref:hypothetical protein n=1 Tax=Sphingobacterium sp. Mn56C TaxID=3395261 RepID=UPI003BCCC243